MFTPLQGQYLSFIAAYERLHNRAPAEADFQRHFGVTPPSVHQMILTLERKGLIARVPGAPRSIKLRISDAELPLLERQRPRRGEHQARPTRSRRGQRRAKGSSKAKAPKTDPAIEYIDSRLMTQRLRYERDVSARIDGRYGVYRTRARLTRRIDGDCTCPSDVWPCKHLRALRATWERNPSSFFDVAAFLRSLRSCEKPELIEAIGRMVVAYPSALRLLGVAGFDVDETEVD